LKEKYQESRDLSSLERFEKPTRTKIPIWGRIIIFSIGVLAVLAIAGLLLPSAVILIQNEGVPQELVIPIKADPEINEVLLTGVVPARETKRILSGSATLQATGSIFIPDEYSNGEVIFTNLTENSIEIPQGSILSTSSGKPILFETTHPGKTPQGSGEQVTIKIKALEAGTSGNVNVGEITRINQEFGADLTVTNLEPTLGGTDLEISSPSQTDKEILTSRLISELKDQASSQLREDRSESDVLFESSLYIVEVITEEIEPEIDTAGDTLTISSSVQFGMLYAAGDDLMELSIETINARYREGIITADPESLRIITPESPPNMIDWEITIQWNEIRTIKTQEIVHLIGGKKTTEAADIVQELLGLDEEPNIRLRPSWWVRLPILPFRISVQQAGE
jgi:hypothetical protein